MAKKKIIHWEQHPSITLVNSKPRLKIFEEFCVEESLPKFQKLLEEEMLNDAKKDKDTKVANTPEDIVPFQTDREMPSEGIAPRPSDLSAAKSAKWDRARYVRLRAGSSGSVQGSVDKSKKGFWASIKEMLKSVKPEPKDEGEISIEEAFALTKESALYMTTEDILRSRAIAVKLVERFKSSCQFAMAKKCQDHLDVLAAKLLLASKGYNKYVTEEQMIEFMTKAERGVQVEYLRYFPEIIPEDVRKKMVQANLDLLFDNYVVAYYSKDAKPVRLLEEEMDEIERRRTHDPILFGVLRGSRALYFVADWIYDDDDLTLATVEKAIGTLPTLKDEKISDSQYKIMQAMQDLNEAVTSSVAEAKARGNFIPINEETMAAAGL